MRKDIQVLIKDIQLNTTYFDKYILYNVTGSTYWSIFNISEKK